METDKLALPTTTERIYDGYGTTLLAIIVPPEFCPQFQEIRTKHITPVNCGPHITLLHPFYSYEHFDFAQEKLTDALKSFPPFKIRVKKFNFFPQKENVLYMEPEGTEERPKAIHELQEACLQVFPSCNHVNKKSSKGFTPHIGMGYFRNLVELKEKMQSYSETWIPVEFTVKEIYILSRVGSVPYEFRRVIPLGGDTSPPLYKTVTIDETHKFMRQINIENIPLDVKAEEIGQFFDEFAPYEVKIGYNKFGVSLGRGQIIFPTRAIQKEALEKFVDKIVCRNTLLKIKPAL